MVSLRRPSPGAITSGYGPRSGGIGSTNHRGIDFSWNNGWTIYAAAAGTVTFAGWVNGYGNIIKIRHALGYSTRYAHQSAFKVRKGQVVKAGQAIGVIGNTGTSAGAHLHFELRLFGVPINPTNKFTTTASDDITPVTPEPELENDMQKLYCETADSQGRHHFLAGEFSFQALTESAAREEWDARDGDVHNIDETTRDRIEARTIARRKEAGIDGTAPAIDYPKLAAEVAKLLPKVTGSPTATDIAAEVIRQMKLPGN